MRCPNVSAVTNGHASAAWATRTCDVAVFPSTVAVSAIGPPTYADATKVAQEFVRAVADRAVWGSDWPHPGPEVHPDDALLFDLLSVWAPDEKVRNRILVDNPKTLYGFA